MVLGRFGNTLNDFRENMLAVPLDGVRDTPHYSAGSTCNRIPIDGVSQVQELRPMIGWRFHFTRDQGEGGWGITNYLVVWLRRGAVDSFPFFPIFKSLDDAINVMEGGWCHLCSKLVSERTESISHAYSICCVSPVGVSVVIPLELLVR